LETLQIRFQASMMSEHRIFWSCLSAIKTLTELSLVYCRLTPDSCILLANELKNFKNLTKLDLEGNPILSVGAGILMTEEINLTYWGFRNCQIDRYCETNDKLVHDFVQHICKQVVYNPFLETIDLRDNCLNSSDYTEILVSYLTILN
jgi:Leucine-rich repeat (LRR) protein